MVTVEFELGDGEQFVMACVLYLSFPKDLEGVVEEGHLAIRSGW
jgi:hypothetical protein